VERLTAIGQSSFIRFGSAPRADRDALKDTSHAGADVVPIPVRDVDGAKDFFTQQVGVHLDHDVRPGEAMRVVQMTPSGSACSIVIGEGLPLGEPGSVKGVQLVVEDLDAVRSELAGRDVAISEVQQMGPEGTPGSRYCFFEDPDGNMWAVQEYKRP